MLLEYSAQASRIEWRDPIRLYAQEEGELRFVGRLQSWDEGDVVLKCFEQVRRPEI